MKAIVEIMGADRNSLREACEEFCNAELHGEPPLYVAGLREQRAAELLDQFRNRHQPNATGMDRLSVVVVLE